jgi:hypothetical protein
MHALDIKLDRRVAEVSREMAFDLDERGEKIAITGRARR